MSKSTTCGTFEANCKLTDMPSANRSASRNRAAADKFAKDMEPILLELGTRRKFNATEIARELNVMGAPCARGGKWHRTTVKRMFERLGSDFEAERRATYIKGEAALQTKVFGKPLEQADVEEMIIHLKNIKQ